MRAKAGSSLNNKGDDDDDEDETRRHDEHDDVQRQPTPAPNLQCTSRQRERTTALSPSAETLHNGRCRVRTRRGRRLRCALRGGNAVAVLRSANATLTGPQANPGTCKSNKHAHLSTAGGCGLSVSAPSSSWTYRLLMSTSVNPLELRAMNGGSAWKKPT